MSKLYRNKSDRSTVLVDIIKSGEDFHNSTKSFRGVNRNADDARLPAWGRMPESDRHHMAFIQDRYGIDYVVFSYNTVIAYRTAKGEWHVPSTKYSPTTTNHQSEIRYAAARLMELESVK